MLVFGRELSCNKFGSIAYKKVLTMQSSFIQLMAELFPWFNVDNISITMPSEEEVGGAAGGKEGKREKDKGLKMELVKL